MRTFAMCIRTVNCCSEALVAASISLDSRSTCERRLVNLLSNVVHGHRYALQRTAAIQFTRVVWPWNTGKHRVVIAQLSSVTRIDNIHSIKPRVKCIEPLTFIYSRRKELNQLVCRFTTPLHQLQRRPVKLAIKANQIYWTTTFSNSILWLWLYKTALYTHFNRSWCIQHVKA